MFLFSIILTLHILAGFIALTVFWIPLITKKGGRIHRKIGWVYVFAMYTVATTALYMGIYRIFFDNTDPEARAFSFFLLFIAILSGATAWMGIRVLRFKRRTEVHRNPFDLGISALLLLIALITMVIGWTSGFPLLQYFPILGILLGSGQLYYWLSPPQNIMHWYFEHYGNLIGCSIATITAFTVFGAPRLLNISSLSIWLWFIPTLLLVPLIYIFNWHYRKKFKIKSITHKRA